ncbi:MAG: ComF family protein [Oscillospiraceae bacterium]|jgi:ComF family protein
MRLKDFFIDLILPNRCPCCGGFIEWDRLVCEKCLSEIEFVKDDVCPHCGKTNCVCDTGLNYSECVVGAYYDGIVRDGILSLKLDNGINFAKFFAQLLSSKLTDRGLCDEIDVVTAVPTTRGKLKQRGYNQAREIAEIISKRIEKPFYDNILTKLDKGLIQHTLDFKSRREAVRGAFGFSAGTDVGGKTVLLCDDIITTSSTLNECACQLKNAGAKKVICTVIATTRLKNQSI